MEGLKINRRNKILLTIAGIVVLAVLVLYLVVSILGSGTGFKG